MSCNTVDVLIVGAGPAGCAAALAARGIVSDVMLCASDPEPDDHEPGRLETVGPAVLYAAADLGIRDCFASARVGSLRQFFRDGQVAALAEAIDDEAAEHWHIDRRRFDGAIRSAVTGSGTVMERTRLTGVRPGPELVECSFADGRTVSSRLLIDAAGRGRGPVPRRRELLSPPLLVSTGVISGDGTDEQDAVTRFFSRPWGWVWSTGSCGNDSGWTALAAADQQRPSEVASLISRSRPESVAHSSATWQINLQKHSRILPVGDAAGTLDPASGLGLANALATALSAADVAHALLGSDDALASDAATYHYRRIALMLRQADELSRRYAATGIFAAQSY